MVGQGLAIRHPDCVSRLLLANTTAVYPAAAQQAWAARIQAVRDGGMSAVLEQVVQRYVHEAFRAAQPEQVQALRATLARQDPQAYVHACEAVAAVNWLDQLHRITCPTHVVAGALDAGATPAMAQAMTERITGARLTVLEHASHLSVAECPDAFGAVLRAWLQA